MFEAARPTVGRIVHFYNPTLGPGGHNGGGEGPYAAIVTQIFPDAGGAVNYANLKVLYPFSEAVDHGSVPEKDSPFYHDGSPYWVWPPRD